MSEAGATPQTVDASIHAALARHPPNHRIVVGFSGGLDSTVLLHAVARQIDDRRRLLALHINHGLSASADAMQQHCEAVSVELGVRFSAQQVRVSPRGSVEAAARHARYEAFEKALLDDDVVWLAHHLDDQAETVLWRLMRGGGVAALAAMPASRQLGRGGLLRPLLDVTRADIAAWAATHGLRWIDDASNADRRFDRNFIRHEVLNAIRPRWPDAAVRLHRAARRFADEAALLRHALDQQLDSATDYDAGDEAGGAARTYAEPTAIAVALLGTPHARPLLRRWLARAGIHGVREHVLAEIVRQAHGAHDRNPEVAVTADFSVCRYQQYLYLVTDVKPVLAPVLWRLNNAPLDIALGRLVARRSAGVGLRASLTVVEVRPRGGGERLRPAGRSGSRSVKRLLSEARVPPWLRDAYPLIYVEGQLAAVPGIAIDGAYAEAPGDAWQLALRRPHGRRDT